MERETQKEMRQRRSEGESEREKREKTCREERDGTETCSGREVQRETHGERRKEMG